jgi:ketosteroid isomerase-like protein
MPTVESVRAIFDTCKDGFSTEFTAYLTEDSTWTCMGTDGPLSRTYPSKAAVLAGFGENAEYWRPGKDQLIPTVQKFIIVGDTAVVELTATGTTKGGTVTRNEDCWILEFRGNQIFKARCYTDTALAKRVWDEGN